MEKERFPGEREPDTAMGTQPGVVGTTGYGLDLPVTETDTTVDEAKARDSANEGGGDVGLTAHDRRHTRDSQGKKGQG